VERVRAGGVRRHLAVERVADRTGDETPDRTVLRAAREGERRHRDVREVDERDVDVAGVPGRERSVLVDGVPLPVVDRAGALAAADVVADPGLALIGRRVHGHAARAGQVDEEDLVRALADDLVTVAASAPGPER